MPLASLLGPEPAELSRIGGFFRRSAPSTRSSSASAISTRARKRASASGAHVFTMKDIDRSGIASIVEQALAIAGAGTAGIHVSFDLDVCDPSIAPGVGTAKGGLDYREAHMVMEMIADQVFRALDLVEVNPILDDRNTTAVLGAGCRRRRWDRRSSEWRRNGEREFPPHQRGSGTRLVPRSFSSRQQHATEWQYRPRARDSGNRRVRHQRQRAEDDAGASWKGGSPHVKSEWTIDGAHIAIRDGRPSMKGRSEAELMPPGTPWRTGADEATTITTDKPLKFGTLSLAPGIYTINTEPGDKGWQLIIGKLGAGPVFLTMPRSRPAARR